MTSFFDELKSEVRATGTKRLDDEFAAGYDEAANICVEIITKKTNDLLAGIDSGQFLSENEQLLLATLNQLKSETEEALRAF